MIAWFKLNEINKSVNKYLYTDIPEHFVFHRDSNSWQPRQRQSRLISSMYNVSLNDPESYYLRLLLNIRGAISFEDLKTMDNKTYETFKVAAIQRKLLADDKEWEEAMAEAVIFKIPTQLRQFSAYICILARLKIQEIFRINFKLF